jgi:DNA-binding NarL/FixJ family response regulator
MSFRRQRTVPGSATSDNIDDVSMIVWSILVVSGQIGRHHAGGAPGSDPGGGTERAGATVDERTDVTGSPLIDVLVVDDHRTFGDAMSIVVNLQPDMTCRGAASSAEDALEWCEARCPDVVLLDVELPGMGGIEAIAPLRERCPLVRVLLLSADTSGGTLVDAVEAGADGFLPKSHPFTDVLEAIRRVDLDVIAEAPSLRRAILHAHAHEPGVGVGPAPELTEREHEILLLLAEGVPVKQVANRLGMTVNTCRGHVAAILRKFDAHSQLAAVITAARHGILPNLRTGATGATVAPAAAIGHPPPPD